MAELNILTTPIDLFHFDHPFVHQCRVMGFDTFEAILRLSAAELLATPGFTYHWLGELSDILTKHDLIHLLQPTPGRSFD